MTPGDPGQDQTAPHLSIELGQSGQSGQDRTGPMASMDRGVRLDRLRTTMAELDLAGLVVTKGVNVRWLTGFTGSSATVLVGAEALVLVTDERYRAQADEQLAEAGVEAEVTITRDLSQPVRQHLGLFDRVGLEAGHITWDRAEAFGGWLADAQLVPTLDLVEDLRRVKDQGEVDRLARAASLADAALGRVAPMLVPGRSERDVALALDRAMLDAGADGLSFPTIVASGPNSAKPHARPSDRALAAGDLVVIDFGAAVDGYGSDMTRTFLLEPFEPRPLELYQAVLAAQAAGRSAVANGVEERAVDTACRDRLAEDGLAEAFVHGTGHGIGLEIHENPILSTRSTGVLRSGYVVTVEPGVYLPGFGGVRIEDSVLVTDDGSEVLTHFPKAPYPQ